MCVCVWEGGAKIEGVWRMGIVSLNTNKVGKQVTRKVGHTVKNILDQAGEKKPEILVGSKLHRTPHPLLSFIIFMKGTRMHVFRFDSVVA